MNKYPVYIIVHDQSDEEVGRQSQPQQYQLVTDWHSAT